ncbi:hypothetical protein CCACVL1_22447 [Corchorus capsularis]|uniref:Protein kinase domain-containing protein n=1 Tax=Corchorus capsularis TaxID=210143 RepID=A0A1R3GYS2_COCAP|nr:hypothetical protein CCACVL1_22447 [Corchorus capsularis]
MSASSSQSSRSGNCLGVERKREVAAQRGYILETASIAVDFVEAEIIKEYARLKNEVKVLDNKIKEGKSGKWVKLLFAPLSFVILSRGSGNIHTWNRDPLPWSTRVQIALDSARVLEYIHEHAVPHYIHHDIKSANILIDRTFHGKVADFGLAKAKLSSKAGSAALISSRLVGTFGYLAPGMLDVVKLHLKWMFMPLGLCSVSLSLQSKIKFHLHTSGEIQPIQIDLHNAL